MDSQEARGFVSEIHHPMLSLRPRIGGPKGGARDARPPWWSKFFHFHAVFGKKLKNNSTFGSWRPPLGKILDPPLPRVGAGYQVIATEQITTI